jgi:hypothetical protein
VTADQGGFEPYALDVGTLINGWDLRKVKAFTSRTTVGFQNCAESKLGSALVNGEGPMPMTNFEHSNAPLHPVLTALRDAIREIEIPVVWFGPQAAVLVRELLRNNGSRGLSVSNLGKSADSNLDLIDQHKMYGGRA